MKKILSLILSIMLVGSLVGCGNKNDTTNGNVENNKKEEIKKEETKSKEIVGINYGESADSGNWNIKINNVEETQEVPKKEKDEEPFKTEGKFINISLQMKNISQEPISYSITDFKIKDESTGKIYAIEDIGYEVAHELISEEKLYNNNNDYITIMDSVNPDSVKTTWITFDLSKDINLDNLLLVNKSMDSTSNEVYFKLK
jgi:predicted small lipoprotein YifL